MTVAFAKAAEIRVNACRKHLARNWERSEGESGAYSTFPNIIMLSKFQKSQTAQKSRRLGANAAKTAKMFALPSGISSRYL